MLQVTELSAGIHRHSLIGAVVLGVTHQSGGEAAGGGIGTEHCMVFVRVPSGQRLRLWFRRVVDFEPIVTPAVLLGAEMMLMTDAPESLASYAVMDLSGETLIHFRSGEYSWHPFAEEEVFAFMLNEKQQAAVQSMMGAIVSRDVDTIAAMLPVGPGASSEGPENFWMWADNYNANGKPLTLMIPPGDVADWDVYGFPANVGQPDTLYLHAGVWDDGGLTGLTIRFALMPEGVGYRIELEDMHVM